MGRQQNKTAESDCFGSAGKPVTGLASEIEGHADIGHEQIGSGAAG